MGRKLRNIALALATAGALVAAGSVPAGAATMYTALFNSQITYVDGNPLGVSLGQTRPNSINFDQSLLVAGPNDLTLFSTDPVAVYDPTIFLALGLGDGFASFGKAGADAAFVQDSVHLIIDFDGTTPTLNYFTAAFGLTDAFGVVAPGDGAYTFEAFFGSGEVDPFFPAAFSSFNARFELTAASGVTVAAGIFELPDFAVPGQQVVPEPGTLVLLGTGLLGLVGYRRRR